VARVVGVSTPTILRWETGEHRPGGEAGLRYAALIAALSARGPEEPPE
jgi:DNA-binding transcriptional regulator YiaG